MAIAPKSGSYRLLQALQQCGGCADCILDNKPEKCRLFGPGLKMVGRIVECKDCKLNNKGPAAAQIVTLLATWLSDKSYICDGRCGNSEPAHCLLGTKNQGGGQGMQAGRRHRYSHLLLHMTGRSPDLSNVTTPLIDETAFRHVLEGLCVPKEDLRKLIKETVTCIGCRTFVESLYAEYFGHTLGFLHVSEDGDIRLAPFMTEVSPAADWSGVGRNRPDGGSAYVAYYNSLFSVCESHLWDEIEITSECRKLRNARAKRCVHHTLESHRTIKCHGWKEVWDMLAKEERQQICLVNSEALQQTILAYVEKHKFCFDCKGKVMRAYQILSGELDPSTEKGYMSPLYRGLTGRPKQKVIDVSPKNDIVSELILRAIPEALAVGTPNEVHAKTFDTAQEQVLLCLGIQLLKDLDYYAMHLHLEFRGERLLVLSSLMAITRKYQSAMSRRGYSTPLDRYEAEQIEMQQRKKEKKQRKKKRKQLQQQVVISSPLPDTSRVRGECNEDEDDEESEGDCRCPASCGTIYSSATYSDESRHSPPSSPSLLGSRVNTHETAARSYQLRDSNDVVLPEGRRKGSRKCSTQQQQDSASSSLGTSPQTSLARESLTSRDSGCHTDGLLSCLGDDELVFRTKMGWAADDEEDVPTISQDIIDEYMANKPRHDEQRQELRARLRRRFDNLNCTNLKMRLPCC